MFKKLNKKGFSHHLLIPVLTIVLVAGIGTVTLKSSSALTTLPSASRCGVGYKFLSHKKFDKRRVTTSVYYKRQMNPYRFTFCTYFTQNYGKSKNNKITIIRPDNTLITSPLTTGAYSKTAKYTVTAAKPKQCIGVKGDMLTWGRGAWGKLGYNKKTIAEYSPGKLCSW